MSSKKPRPVPQPADLIPGLCDAHTHLQATSHHRGAPDAPATVADLITRAQSAGVNQICTVGDGLDEAAEAVRIAQTHPQVWAACAIHPTRAHELDDNARRALVDLVHNPRCVAVGETGIDTYWISHAPDRTASLEQQEEAFRWHIDLAVSSGKALMIHNRDADEHVLRILADSPRPKDVILHCFSSPAPVAEEALNRGYVLSFCGNTTFKRNSESRDIAARTPSDLYLIETDAPYMTPEPYRGTRNESAFIGHTARCIAEARGVDVARVAHETSANFHRVYGLDN
ncbi:YchF/TatD family DNA exonuclease [Corynebacterium poyangense]|uniref:YchF/TatD family DNA exonuclease n=1 Tax=Corynebacterium poyangense TaxID=2684405 RepID=A0A7H0SMX7_9CORY|nr:TatD family hydrolase [Corynebacterium poyangense]MBZ8176266.1 YchF/TatD family DNA exonuclease [Corynebacterium poyangense]QNQ89902.1 YchF/TatD family DNA exonuclease [Corynebacterium poyangense]